MKRWISLLLAAVMLLSLVCLSGCGKKRTLNVYNWGEYISETPYNTIREFENWYEATYGEKVKVNYTTFDSNESMYSKIASGAVSYDVIIPSDYMIERMIEEDRLLPIDFSNVPNYQFIDESFRGLFYDPDNLYTVPYTYGVVGVIYNAAVVDEADAGDWDLMWNEKYQGKILQFSNPRDAFGTAMYKLGIDVNTTDKEEWERALSELKKQSPLVMSYVMDEIYNMMENGEAAIGAYYAGDYFTMLENETEGVDLRFYYPEHTNYYVDAMCIPSCCQDKELAEIFINFMLSEEPAVANALQTYYASPNSLVYNSAEYREELGEEAMAVLYPGIDNFRELYNLYAYHNLSQDMLEYITNRWDTYRAS